MTPGQAIALKPEQALGQIESLLIKGDLSVLNEAQRVQYYRAVCDSVGLNPLTKPFDYIMLNGKLTLYAKRDATDQLRKIHAVSIQISSRETIEGVYVVTARAKLPSGREDESTGAVTITGLKGDNLANAFMKAETKSKRRATLSICGLGLLDETEVSTINEMPVIMRDQPGENDGVQGAGPWRAEFGKHAGKGLDQIAREIGPQKMAEYASWLVNKAEESGKPLNDRAQDLVNMFGQYIKDWESGALEGEPGSDK